MDALPPLAAGSRVDPYTIEAPIGQGGFGTVYRARADDGTLVALKVGSVPAPQLTAQQVTWQQNEIEALRRLHHPALVRILGEGAGLRPGDAAQHLAGERGGHAARKIFFTVADRL